MIALVVYVPEPTKDSTDIVGPFFDRQEVVEYINKCLPKGYRYEIVDMWEPDSWERIRCCKAPPASGVENLPDRVMGRR